jgi:hypothetical protein
VRNENFCIENDKGYRYVVSQELMMGFMKGIGSVRAMDRRIETIIVVVN